MANPTRVRRPSGSSADDALEHGSSAPFAAPSSSSSSSTTATGLAYDVARVLLLMLCCFGDRTLATWPLSFLPGVLLAAGKSSVQVSAAISVTFWVSSITYLFIIAFQLSAARPASRRPGSRPGSRRSSYSAASAPEAIHNQSDVEAAVSAPLLHENSQADNDGAAAHKAAAAAAAAAAAGAEDPPQRGRWALILLATLLLLVSNSLLCLSADYGVIVMTRALAGVASAIIWSYSMLLCSGIAPLCGTVLASAVVFASGNLGDAVGPWLGSLSFDATGTINGAYAPFLVLPMLASLLALIVLVCEHRRQPVAQPVMAASLTFRERMSPLGHVLASLDFWQPSLLLMSVAALRLMLDVLVPLYLTTLGYSTLAIGRALAVSCTFFAIGSVVGGKYCVRTHPMPAMLLVVLGSCALTVPLLFLDNIYWFTLCGAAMCMMTAPGFVGALNQLERYSVWVGSDTSLSVGARGVAADISMVLAMLLLDSSIAFGQLMAGISPTHADQRAVLWSFASTCALICISLLAFVYGSPCTPRTLAF